MFQRYNYRQRSFSQSSTKVLDPKLNFSLGRKNRGFENQGRKNPGFENQGRKFPGRVTRPVVEPWFQLFDRDLTSRSLRVTRGQKIIIPKLKFKLHQGWDIFNSNQI